MRRVLGWAFLIAAASAAGCGSSKGPSASGSAGTTGQAGTSGAGGTTGGAGSGGAGGGAAGAAGTGGTTGNGGGGGAGGAAGGAPVTCPNGLVTPTEPTIADFTMVDGGMPIQFMGGTTSFGTPSPEVMLSGGNLHALVTVASGPEPQTIGFGIYFRHCVDAGAYSGVKFDMSGSVDGCTMSYAFTFSEDAWNPSLVDAGTGGDANGTCTLGPTACYPPSTTITPTTQTVMFSAVSGGAPAHTVDKNRLTGLVWQFAIDARPDGGPTTACIVDVTIDNITFVQ